MRDSAIYNYIKRIFNRYDDIKKAIWEARNDSYIPFGFEGGHAHVSDTTANKAISAVMPIKAVFINNDKEMYKVFHPEDWITVYESTCNYYAYNKLLSDFIHMRYREHANDIKISVKLNISKTTQHEYHKKIMAHAALIAVQMNLIKIY
ncbi:hypothetical protein [Pectinatus frisingensis]|uniref:hypothetical protein n=1 Tax=Pectinatus frisingensis TaxID=865 RepID=UPI003D80307F